jgi:transitional endoplasmic reticulum ATPase
MEEDPGSGTVYLSQSFMKEMQVSSGDVVELLGDSVCVVQAKEHPNPWIDTRMVSVDKQTLEKGGFQLFGQVKIRKTRCVESERIVLEVPDNTGISRTHLRKMLEKIQGAVIKSSEPVGLQTPRGELVELRIVECRPENISRISTATHVEFITTEGEEYVSRRDTTFSDVGGLDEAVKKVREVVQLPLRHPEIFYQLGIDPPRGVLLHGPSGTGKTLIARAVAGETGCYFKAISGSEIMDKHYGESEAKLRAAFEDAYKNAPAIIFIDEIDAMAPRRDTAEGDVEKRITAQLLALMDGLEDRGAIIVIAATNLPNLLDSALRRPGRFDREVLIGVPDKRGRSEILKIHTRDMPIDKIDLEDLAERTHGFVGADLKALCQEAGFHALRRILPGLEDTHQELSDDFLEAISVEEQDFEAVLKDMRPSSGRNYDLDLTKAGWDKIAGYDQEMAFIRDIILWPLQNITSLSKVGVVHSTGLLITGPSGTGKSLIARSLAKESGFNVIEIRGPELISKYMGESEKNIRELFRQARQMAPTIVILDGVDAIAVSGWSDSKVIDRIVNQLVTEMNAISGDKPVMVVAVCNRAVDLPPALRSTGKLGTELKIKLPEFQDRESIFRLYLNRDAISFRDDFTELAAASEGLSGGDIEEICRRAVLQTAKKLLESGGGELTRIEINAPNVLDILEKWKMSPGYTERN